MVNPKALEKTKEEYERKSLANGYMIRKKIKEPKRLTLAEKYLQYLDWQKKQNWSWYLLDISKNISQKDLDEKLRPLGF